MQKQTYRPFYQIVEPPRGDSNQSHIYATRLREFVLDQGPMEIRRQATRDEGGMPLLRVLLNELAAALETFARRYPEQCLTLPAPKPGKADDGWHVFSERDCLITLTVNSDQGYVSASVGRNSSRISTWRLPLELIEIVVDSWTNDETGQLMDLGNEKLSPLLEWKGALAPRDLHL